MATLVIGIETVGDNWDDLDVVTQESLTHWIDSASSLETERDLRLQKVQNNLALSPFTGSIIVISLYDLEREQGAIYFNGDNTEITLEECYSRSRNEKEMLEDFWESVRSYDRFVTFNGRKFVIPYILLRSAMLGITPTQPILGKRVLEYQQTIQHIDVFDQLTFYGALAQKPSLHLCCRAFGVQSPVSSECSSRKIAELFHAKKFDILLKYHYDEVCAITELYKKWHDHLAPQSFRFPQG